MSPIAVKAFWFGIISAISLPVGSIIGILFKPKSRVLSAIMSFGAGALLSALSFELVYNAFKNAGFVPLAAGAILGGVLFDLLNKMLNEKGAFLRKAATITKFLSVLKKEKVKNMFERLHKISAFYALPPEEINSIIPLIKEIRHPKGSVIFSQNDTGDALYFIIKGEVEINRDGGAGRVTVSTLKENDLFGEMALITGEKRSAAAMAKSDTVLWRILKKDFDALMIKYPALRSVFDESCRARIKDLGDKKIISAEDAAVWVNEAIHHTDDKYFLPTQEEIKAAAGEKQKAAAAFAIWLGLFLDGIPESLVIGVNMIQSSVSIALIAGLFLSNLPESMASAVIMKRQGTSSLKIMLLWCSLVIITGIGAFLGSTLFINSSSFTVAFFEGFAAGAMLCMISETMLPEAYEQGGTIVGISTLLGFLATIFLSSLQH